MVIWSVQATQTRSRVITCARALAQGPLIWIHGTNLVLPGIGFGWGLPSSVGRDDDGVALRDLLFGVLRTFQPGSFYTCPPLRLVFLTLLATH